MRRFFAFLTCLFLAFCVVSCGSRESAEDVLYRICSDIELPSGATYLSGAPEGSAFYLSPDTARAMYGEDVQDVFSLVEEYAIYLSRRAMPSEVAVFRCYSRSDADRVLRLCLARVENMKIQLSGTEYASIAEGVDIRVRGRVVIMTLAPDEK